MKDKIQIALLALIAVALGVIAYKQLAGGDSGSSTSGSVVAASNNAVAAPAGDTFDPMAKSTPVVEIGRASCRERV